MGAISTCKLCGREKNPDYRFCYRCFISKIDSPLFSVEELDELSSEFAEEFMELMRQSPDLDFASLPDEQRLELQRWAKDDLAPSQFEALRISIGCAQKKVEKMMYYGQEMILPDNPFWTTLTEGQQSSMLVRHKTFQEYRNRSIVFAFFLYCLIAPFLGTLSAFVLGLSIQLVLTGIVVSWYNPTVNSLTKQIALPISVIGITFMIVMTWLNRNDWLVSFIGVMLFAIVTSYLHAFSLWPIWQLRERFIEIDLPNLDRIRK